MCTPSESLRISPLYARKVLFKKKIAQSLLIRGEVHCHEMNPDFFPARKWPAQNMDFLMDDVFSQFGRKNRRKC